MGGRGGRFEVGMLGLNYNTYCVLKELDDIYAEIASSLLLSNLLFFY